VDALHRQLAAAAGGICTFDIDAAGLKRTDQWLRPWAKHDVQLVQIWQREQVELRKAWAPIYDHLIAQADQLMSFNSWNETQRSCYQHLLLPHVQRTALELQQSLLILGTAQLQYARGALYAQLLQQLQSQGLCDGSRGEGGKLQQPSSDAHARATAATAEAKARADKAQQEVQTKLACYVQTLEKWEEAQQLVGSIPMRPTRRLGLLLHKWAEPGSILPPSYQQPADKGKAAPVSGWGSSLAQRLKRQVSACASHHAQGRKKQVAARPSFAEGVVVGLCGAWILFLVIVGIGTCLA
jgi:hypothetical protein